MKDKQQESFIRLKHILHAIESVQKHVNQINVSLFKNDDLIQDAVLFQFTVIGEAIIHVDADIVNKYDYPWYKVRSFRNLIAHEYFNIRMDAVWEIIQYDLPNLKELMLKILADEF